MITAGADGQRSAFIVHLCVSGTTKARNVDLQQAVINIRRADSVEREGGVMLQATEHSSIRPARQNTWNSVARRTRGLSWLKFHQSTYRARRRRNTC